MYVFHSISLHLYLITNSSHIGLSFKPPDESSLKKELKWLKINKLKKLPGILKSLAH